MNSLFVLIGLFLNIQNFGQPTQENPTANCVPFHELKSDTVAEPLMTDLEGDLWVRLHVVNNGDMFVGYIMKNRAMFCMMGRGKTAPET